MWREGNSGGRGGGGGEKGGGGGGGGGVKSENDWPINQASIREAVHHEEEKKIVYVLVYY